MFPHFRFQNIEFSLSVFHDMIQNFTINFCLCQNRKLELSIDILIVYEKLFDLVKGTCHMSTLMGCFWVPKSTPLFFVKISSSFHFYILLGVWKDIFRFMRILWEKNSWTLSVSQTHKSTNMTLIETKKSWKSSNFRKITLKQQMLIFIEIPATKLEICL